MLGRAREIADHLEQTDEGKELTGMDMDRSVSAHADGMTQLSIFDAMGGSQTDNILFELRDIDLTGVTPMDAMNLIYKWQNQLKEKW